MFRPVGPSIRRRAAVALALCVIPFLVQAPLAAAGPGYQLDTAKPSISLSAEVPIGVAVDQSSQDVYVAELSRGVFNSEPGEVEQLTSSGVPTAASPFGTGGEDLFIAVAVNPVTHGVYAYQGEVNTSAGHKGKSTLNSFSSSGVLGTSFFPPHSLTGTIASDSSGRVVFPNSEAGSVQIFSSSGTLESTITCGGCPGGGFGSPDAAAFDSTGNLYVVDRSGAGRLLRFAPSGGGYVYNKTIQSGGGVVAVAVDTSNDDVFSGNLTAGKYHVVAYDSSGTPFDDFSGLTGLPQLEEAVGQLAVNSTTHKLYLSNPAGKNLWVFERIASIPAPTASTSAPSPVGQLTATLRATVNPKGHVLTDCEFEYTDHADFLANGWANAETAACPAVVGDPEAVQLTAPVSGLSAETSYDYRIGISSYGGTAEGAAKSFQTLPPLPPEATTGAASAVTRVSATLAGSVNPKGGTVSSCVFQYVTEAAFQGGGFGGAASKPCLSLPSGNVANSVTAKVTGLEAGTGYRFRVVATNNSGTTEASASSFTTVAETCAENAALCPPEEPSGGSPPAESGPSSPILPPWPTGTPSTKKPLKCRKGFKKKRIRGKLKCVKAKKQGGKRRHRPPLG